MLEKRVTARVRRAARTIAQLHGVQDADLDLYLGALRDRQARRNRRGRSARSWHPETVGRELASSGLELVKIYESSRIPQTQVVALGEALESIEEVLSLRDPRTLDQLPQDVRQRLESGLFEPLATLAAAGAEQRQGLLLALGRRDVEPLRAQIQAPIEFTWVDFSSLQEVEHPFAALSRYAPGDRVVVGVGGAQRVGIVVGVQAERLTVETLEKDGVDMVDLSQRAVHRFNPFKIGDHLKLPRREVFIGVGPKGVLEGISVDPAGRRRRLGRTQLLRLAARLKRERLDDRSAILCSGGEETADVEVVLGRTVDGALFTSRGPNDKDHGVHYKSYNEDAATLGVLGDDEREVVYLGVSDQAGGMGNIPGRTGAMSDLAARCLEKAARAVVKGEGVQPTLARTVKNLQRRARRLNRAHDVEAITTLTGAIVHQGKVHAVNVGDSKLLHFSASGELKNETRTHNEGDALAEGTGDPNAGLEVATLLTECIGARESPNPDFYEWAVESGDFLVAVSDGVLDANLLVQEDAALEGKPWARHNSSVTNAQLAAIMQRTTSASQAARSIRDYALAQMARGHGKPDNISVVVVRVG